MCAARGEVTAVLGPNGAGKTTTIEVCEGYRRPDAGTVRVLGLDPVKDARKLRPRVGVMLQSGGIPTAARPADYLKVMARIYARPVEPPMMLDRLGVTPTAKSPVRRMPRAPAQPSPPTASLIP